MNNDTPEPPNTARHRAGLPPHPQTPAAACRVMNTRPCPAVYAGPCGDRPCARFESDDPTPWTDTAATEATQPDTFPGRLAALHEQILRNLIKGVEEIKDHALRAARTGQSDLALSTDVEITEGQPETCTATLSGAPIAGSLHRCSAPAGHYDETRRPTARGEERDTGGWHYTTPSETGDQVVWADHADGATPHETRCPGCGHTDGEGCGCPTPPFTTLEVHEDETPAALRELTDVVRELVAVMREDTDGRTEDAEATDLEPTAPATTCSAQHRIYDDGRQCIRAAQHHGDHIDERGFHWSDTVAMYPVAKMISHDGPLYSQPFEQRRPDWLSGTRDLSIPEQRPTLRERHRAAWQTLTPAEQAARLDALDTDDLEKTKRLLQQKGSVLNEVLAAFVHKVHGYLTPRLSAEVDVVTLDKWRSLAALSDEAPWWKQVDDLRTEVATVRGELDQSQAAVTRVREYLQLQLEYGSFAVDPADVWSLLNQPQPTTDEPTADAPNVAHPDANQQASGSPGVDGQIRAYIDTALREGYWKHVDQHTHRLLDDLAQWTPVGVLGSIEGLDDSEEDPAAPAFAWPHLHSKTALTARLETSFTYTRGPFDEVLAGFDAIYRARLDRRLARLARALGQWEDIVRRDFHAVQRVLEDAGVLDGYGRLTIPQPVRPPVVWEAL